MICLNKMQTNSNFVVPLDKTERKEALFEAIKRNDANAVEAILNSGYKPNKRIGDIPPMRITERTVIAMSSGILIFFTSSIFTYLISTSLYFLEPNPIFFRVLKRVNSVTAFDSLNQTSRIFRFVYQIDAGLIQRNRVEGGKNSYVVHIGFGGI